MNTDILTNEITIDTFEEAETLEKLENLNIPETIINTDYTSTNIGKELVAANDNIFPTLPTDPKALPAFITIASKAVEAESKLLKRLVINPGKYKFALQQAQKHAALLLEAQLRLAEVLRGIKIRRGIRTDLKTKANKIVKSKKEIIANDYNLTIRQARDIEKLTKECVAKAIQEAFENNDIPTRALALSKLGKKAPEERGKDVYTPVMEKHHKKLTLEQPLYYTSLFANVGIGTYYLKDIGIKCTVANELLSERAKWHEEIYPDCEMVQGSFTDDEVFNKLVKLHNEKDVRCS